jgi:transcriptional regulator with XRE-family HTH domain
VDKFTEKVGIYTWIFQVIVVYLYTVTDKLGMNRIKELAKEKHILLGELARGARISRNALTGIIKGSNPRLVTAQAIAARLGEPIEVVFPPQKPESSEMIN